MYVILYRCALAQVCIGTLSADTAFAVLYQTLTEQQLVKREGKSNRRCSLSNHACTFVPC